MDQAHNRRNSGSSLIPHSLLITWRKPIPDSIRKWGQLLAFLPGSRPLIDQHGPSLVLLPAPRLDRRNLEKASENLNILAKKQAKASQHLRNEAREAVFEELGQRGEQEMLAWLSDS